MKYYIEIDNNRLVGKYSTNDGRAGLTLSKEEWDLIPDDLHLSYKNPKYDYINGKAIERTDKEYLDAVKAHEDEEKIKEEKIKHDEAVWAKAYEIAEKELDKI